MSSQCVEQVLFVESLLSELAVSLCGTCSVGRELAESSQCVELVLFVESLLSELAVSLCGTCSVGRELAESSQCVELVLLSWLSLLSVWNLFCW